MVGNQLSKSVTACLIFCHTEFDYGKLQYIWNGEMLELSRNVILLVKAPLRAMYRKYSMRSHLSAAFFLTPSVNGALTDCGRISVFCCEEL